MHTRCLPEAGPVMCQHLCFVLFLISRRFLLFGCCAINTDSCVCASLSSFLFLSLPLSPFYPVLHVAAPGSKGPTRREGESTLSPLPFRPGHCVRPVDSWGLSEAPAQPSRWHALRAELPAGPAGPQPLTPFPNSFHTIRLGSRIPGLSPKPLGEWVSLPPSRPPHSPACCGCLCLCLCLEL